MVILSINLSVTHVHCIKMADQHIGTIKQFCHLVDIKHCAEIHLRHQIEVALACEKKLQFSTLCGDQCHHSHI